MIPYRLIAYGLAGAAIVGALTWGVHDVRSAYRARAALPIARAERDAAVAAQARSEQSVARQIAVNEEIERETVRKLAAADAAARDLARRLLHARRQARPVCPASAAPGNPDGTAGEPAGADEIGEATAAYIAACDGDAVRLNALQGYVRGLPHRCVPD